MWVDIREPHTGRLLCRYDANRRIIEFQERKVKTVVDLTQYEAPESAKESDSERRYQERRMLASASRTGESCGRDSCTGN